MLFVGTTFLTKNDFIVGANNPPGQMFLWVDCTIQIKIKGEMSNTGNNTNQSHIDILDTLEGENENFRTLNGKDVEKEDFMSLDLQWFILYVTVTDTEENKVPSPHLRK